ncbi:MAG: trypsin-like serine protease [Methylobacteriaceae bacterium]|nr:trypsin-like serine protease [Methylobacteriaceae bacterium]
MLIAALLICAGPGYAQDSPLHGEGPEGQGPNGGAPHDPGTSGPGTSGPGSPGQGSNLEAVGNPSLAPLKWTGLLLVPGKYKCTAQFIAPRVVLTAAHCVADQETGELDPDKTMQFLLQWQNGQWSQLYRPVCRAYPKEWMPERKPGQSQKDLETARVRAHRWDYAMILVDQPSITGYYNWEADWKDNWKDATATGYPRDIAEGKVVEEVHGNLQLTDLPNVVALDHGNSNFTEGASGGVWVGNFSTSEGKTNNVALSLESFGFDDRPGVSYGPQFTGAFQDLLKFTANGCK